MAKSAPLVYRTTSPETGCRTRTDILLLLGSKVKVSSTWKVSSAPQCRRTVTLAGPRPRRVKPEARAAWTSAASSGLSASEQSPGRRLPDGPAFASAPELVLVGVEELGVGWSSSRTARSQGGVERVLFGMGCQEARVCRSEATLPNSWDRYSRGFLERDVLSVTLTWG